jgi:hypothetical protein
MTFRACGAHKTPFCFAKMGESQFFAKQKKKSVSAVGMSMRGTNSVAKAMGIKHALKVV